VFPKTNPRISRYILSPFFPFLLFFSNYSVLVRPRVVELTGAYGSQNHIKPQSIYNYVIPIEPSISNTKNAIFDGDGLPLIL